MVGVRRAISVASVALAVPACGQVPEAEGEPQPKTEEATELTVINHNWSDITIYVVQHGAQPIRLGLVTSLSRARFEVPSDLVGSGRVIRLMADPVGQHEAFLSERIQVFPGDLIEWRLENRLQQSALSIY